MMTNGASTMRLLLIKSDGQFKHSGKYYLLHGRWHKLHADKPTPKGAAVAAHPHAAGAPTQGHATMSDEEWGKLKLPPENSNAGTFNKQIDQLKAAAAAGDVTGILGSAYGTNTYGKKLAIIANHTLELMGSSHKVTPGQKAGAHAAVQTAPQIEAAQPAPAEPAAVEPQPAALHTFTNPETNMQAKVVIGKNGTYNVVLQDLDSGEYVPTVHKYVDEEKAIASAKSAAGVKDAEAPAAAPPTVATPASADAESIAMHRIMAPSLTNPAISAGAFKGDNPVWYSQSNPSEIALSAKVSFMGSQPSEPAKKQYELVQAAQAAGYSFTSYMKANGGKQGVYLLQKDGKVLTKKGAEALMSGGSAPAADAGPKEGDTKPAADGGVLVLKDGHWVKEGHAGPVADKAQAAHAAWLKNMQGSKTIELDGEQWYVLNEGTKNQNGTTHVHLASASQGVMQGNGWYPKQINTDVVSELLDPAPVAAAPSALTMPEFDEGKTTTGVKAYYEKLAAKIIAHAEAGNVAVLEDMPSGTGNTWKGKTPNSKKLLALHAAALLAAGKPAAAEAPAAPTEAPKKEPRMVLPKKARALTDEQQKENLEALIAGKPIPHLLYSAKTPATSSPAAGNSKLDQINWDGLKLPDGNSNATSINKKLAALKQAAYAGDAAAIEAMQWGKNTYNKKLALVAQTALAAMKESAPVAGSDAATSGSAIAGVPAYDYLHNTLKNGGFADDAVQDWLAANPGKSEEAKEALTSLGYDHLAHLANEEPGPKYGDTKPGANGGTLVFKNGRWHKQGDDQAAAPAPAADPEQSGPPAPPAAFDPTGGNPKWAQHYATIAKALHDKVVAEGAAAFKGVVVNHSDGRFTVTLAGFKLKKIGPNDNAEYRKQMHAYITALKESVGKPKKASKKKAAAAPQSTAPAPTSSGIESMDAWQQTGPQGGSNPGGRFKDPAGVEWYCKFPGDDDVAKSEVLAAKLYAALGIAGQDAKLITKDGKIGIASRWVTVQKAGSPAALAATDGVASGFGADAWLANWDVVGLGFDNLQVGTDGKAMRVDAGGSLQYRAQGGKKAFGNIVTEIDSLRDPAINPQAAAVFGKLTGADITASVAKVLQLPDATIRALCFTHGPGSEADRKALADTLIARKADLAAKFPKAAKPAKKRLDPNNLPVDAKILPKPHDFANWNGPGKGLSSQPHVNAANVAVEQEIIELARTGNLTKLKDFHFHQIDKNTGTATGLMVPIKNHPSKHVVQFHADLVQLLDEIANPPEPLKLFAEAEVSTLDALSAAFPPKPFGTTVSSVKSNEKLGFWVVLGGVADAHKFAPKKTSNFSTAAIQAAYQKYKEANPLAKHFINSVQASGSYNDLFRDGKEKDGHGNSLKDVAAAALGVATEQPEGTSVYRWQKMTADMIDKVMSAPDGTVFQATGPMCTSYSPTATAGFGTHRVTIRYAKGAKAVESFGSKAFSGEKEVTTLPNSRFVILKKEMVPDVEHGNPGGKRLELEILMLPPDLGVA